MHNQIQQFLRRNRARSLVVDWVETWPSNLSGKIKERYYRGQIDSIQLRKGTPKIHLVLVRRYERKSRSWHSTDRRVRRWFDFSEFKSKGIDFQIEVLASKLIRFGIALQISGVIVPKNEAKLKHPFAGLTQKKWERQVELILR